VYQAGTLSGNPLAMAAGLATLRTLRDHPDFYDRMNTMTASLVEGIAEAARSAGVALTCNRVGSMFTCFFTQSAVSNWEQASSCDTQAFGRYFRGMLDAGVYLPPSQFEAAFMSAAHTEKQIAVTIAAAREALAQMQA